MTPASKPLCSRCGAVVLDHLPTTLLIARPTGRPQDRRQVVVLCRDCDRAVALVLERAVELVGTA